MAERNKVRPAGDGAGEYLCFFLHIPLTEVILSAWLWVFAAELQMGASAGHIRYLENGEIIMSAKRFGGRCFMFASVALALGWGVCVQAADFSFTGNFTNDNDVQLFTFSNPSPSPDVLLRTWSYAGGTNAAGAVIASGGFDPILAVFNSAGALVNQNDDGGGSVPADAVTGAHYDTYLDLGALPAGTFTVSVMQYNNFANGPTLANGFVHDGAADTAFTHLLVGQALGSFLGCD